MAYLTVITFFAKKYNSQIYLSKEQNFVKENTFFSGIFKKMCFLTQKFQFSLMIL
jgi:hypothetical protein